MPPVFKARVVKILVMFLLVNFLALGMVPPLPAQAAAASRQVSKALPANLPVGTQPNRTVTDQMLTGTAVGIAAIWVHNDQAKEQTIFHVGDWIIIGGMFYNNTGKSQTAPTIWEVKGPCDPLYTLNGDYVITDPGYVLTYTTLLTPDICGGSYVMTIRVTYQGATTSLSKSFYIVNPAKQKGFFAYLPFVRK